MTEKPVKEWYSPVFIAAVALIYCAYQVGYIDGETAERDRHD
jgi:hypothetical protein